MAADEPGCEKDRIELEARFSQLRPEILETMRKPHPFRRVLLCFTRIVLGLTNHLQQALTLATACSDFSSLASLLLRPTPYPPSASPQATLIKNYLDQYGYAFGREVVRWCIEHGEARVLFAEEDVWRPYMDDVFAGRNDGKGKQRENDVTSENNEFNSIAWVNDIAGMRFGTASSRLLQEAKGATEVGQRHVSDVPLLRGHACTQESWVAVHIEPRKTWSAGTPAGRWGIE